MTLAARQVVLAVRDRLIAAATAAGTRVYASRAWPLAAYPALRVFASDEDLQAAAGEDMTWPQSREHRLQLDVQGTVQDADDAEGDADALAAQVLEALEGTRDAARLAPLNCALQAQRIGRQMVAEGEASVCRITVRFEVLFGTESNDPHTIT